MKYPTKTRTLKFNPRWKCAGFRAALLIPAALLAGILSCPAGVLSAVDDTGATNEDTVLTSVDPGSAEPSLLTNDMGAGLTVIGSDATSANGAAVSVASDGTFSYNPTGAATIQTLAQGAPLADTFDYTITDSLTVANGRFVKVMNNGAASRRMDIGEIEVFAPGVTPAVDHAGGTGNLNPTTDLATTANGASVHSKTTNQPHGGDDDGRLIDGRETTGGGTWSSNGVGNFVIIDLGASVDIALVRVHQRNDCCYDRLRDFTVSVLEDDGTGEPGAEVASGSYPGQPPNSSFGAVSLASVGATATATVTVNVTGVNDAPTANNATFTVSEDGPAITEAMAGSDVDVPDTLTFSTTTSPAMGILTDNGNGTFTFDPNGEFESLASGEPGVVSFDFQVQDTLLATATATITIVVQGVNDDPAPMPDGGTTDEDTLLTVLAASGLLSNDDDTDGDVIGVQSIDTTGTVGIVTADLMGLKLGAGLSGTFYDFNGPNPDSIGGNDTGNQTALLLPLPNPGNFVLQRLGLTPSATVITPRVDFGTGTNVNQGDGSVLDRGGFNSGAEPPWQGLFNDIGETADMDGDQIAAVWSGKIEITAPGDYTFTTRSDDATNLFIDGVRVVDNNNFQGMTNRFGTVVGLTAGLHDIAIGGYEGGGGAGMQASYEGPDTTGRVIIPPTVLFNDVATSGTFVSGGLRGDYYDTNNSGTNGLTFGFNVDEFLLFTTTPEMDVAMQSLFPSFTDVLSPRIDFGNDTTVVPGDGSNPERGGIQGNIYGGIGVAPFDGDQVGGVWTGSLLVPENAEFQFWQRIDDGGVVLIDVDGNGSVHDPGDFVIGQGNADGTVTLSAGPHKIVVAAREGGGDHRMVVSWAQLDGALPFAREVIPPTNLLLPGTGMVGDGSFTYDPNGQFEFLNHGETATDTFTYTVTDPFGGIATETVTITITGVIDTTPIYDNWATSFSLIGPAADPLADTESPTSDGLVQLLEFAFGTNPNLSDNVLLEVTSGTTFTPGNPIPSLEFSPLNLTYRFVRRVDHVAAGLIYTPEFSADGMNFEASTDTPTVVVPDDGTGYEVVEVPFMIFLPGGMKSDTALAHVVVTLN